MMVILKQKMVFHMGEKVFSGIQLFTAALCFSFIALPVSHLKCTAAG